MSITEKEQELFSIWRQRTESYKPVSVGGHGLLSANASFVEDGVVDEEVFSKEQIRYVFILKEVNDLSMPLTMFLREGARTINNGNGGHTWNPVCRWVTRADASRAYSTVERAEILKKIAVMNLKKYDEAKPITDMRQLELIVKEDKDLLRTQIEIYAAYGNVIFVCCGPGMFDLVVGDVMGIDTKTIDHAKKPTYYVVDKDKKAFIMAFNHPNARKSGLTESFKKYTQEIVECENMGRP